MGDTMFNIFGDHLFEPTKKTNITNINENVGSGKLGLLTKNSTPSRFNKNLLTPKNVDLKKKSFLHNEGASIQAFYPKYNTLKNPLQSAIKQPLKVYEDLNLSNKKMETEDMDSVEYSYKNINYDDESDDDLKISDEQLRNILFSVPPSHQIKPSKLEEPEMLKIDNDGDSISDIFSEDCSDDLECSSYSLPTIL